MGPEWHEQDAIARTNVPSPKHLVKPVNPRVLIVIDDDSISGAAELLLLHSGLASERVKSMKAGCEFAKSGRFQVVFASPVLGDGSWTRLAEIDRRYRPGFVIILLATNFDLNEWGQALQDGAFEVLDALNELPRVADVARCALWAAYLKGASLRPELLHPSGVA